MSERVPRLLPASATPWRATAPSKYDHYQEPPAKTIAPPNQSVLALVSADLGLISLFLSILTGVPAIILGHIALFKVSRSGGKLTGRGLTIFALIVGCLALAIYIFRPIP